MAFHPAGSGSNLSSRDFFSDAAELTDCSTLLRQHGQWNKLNSPSNPSSTGESSTEN